jgi:hypothetical protein
MAQQCTIMIQPSPLAMARESVIARWRKKTFTSLQKRKGERGFTVGETAPSCALASKLWMLLLAAAAKL